MQLVHRVDRVDFYELVAAAFNTVDIEVIPLSRVEAPPLSFRIVANQNRVSRCHGGTTGDRERGRQPVFRCSRLGVGRSYT